MKSIPFYLVPLTLAVVSCGKSGFKPDATVSGDVAPPPRRFAFSDAETWQAANRNGDAALLLVSCEHSRFSQHVVDEDREEFVSRYTFNRKRASPSGGLERTVVFLNEEQTECYAVNLFPKYRLVSMLQVRPLSRRGAAVFIGQLISGGDCYEVNEEGAKLLKFETESAKVE